MLLVRDAGCVPGLHEADDRVVDHLGGPAGHWAAAVQRDLDRAAAAPADLGEVGEPLKESALVSGWDLFLPGEEPEGVLPVDRRDQVGENMMQGLGARDDLGF